MCPANSTEPLQISCSPGPLFPHPPQPQTYRLVRLPETSLLDFELQNRTQNPRNRRLRGRSIPPHDNAAHKEFKPAERSRRSRRRRRRRFGGGHVGVAFFYDELVVIGSQEFFFFSLLFFTSIIISFDLFFFSPVRKRRPTSGCDPLNATDGRLTSTRRLLWKLVTTRTAARSRCRSPPHTSRRGQRIAPRFRLQDYLVRRLRV